MQLLGIALQFHPFSPTRMTESLQGRSTVMNDSPDNGRIGLFSNPVVAREVVTGGLWDMDAAFTEMESAFQEAILRPNPFAPKV